MGKVKHSGEKRPRLCIASCNDQQHSLFTAAPTMKRISIRILLCMVPILNLPLTTGDEIETFAMSKTTLRRPFCLRGPSEMEVPKGMVLIVIQSLYGMPESPLHWFKTYSDYYRQKLGMKQFSMNRHSCLRYLSQRLKEYLGFKLMTLSLEERGNLWKTKKVIPKGSIEGRKSHRVNSSSIQRC